MGQRIKCYACRKALKKGDIARLIEDIDAYVCPNRECWTTAIYNSGIVETKEGEIGDSDSFTRY